jgi:antitoxin component YwqK of YwqJK toxin-antitoxin module
MKYVLMLIVAVAVTVMACCTTHKTDTTITVDQTKHSHAQETAPTKPIVVISPPPLEAWKSGPLAYNAAASTFSCWYFRVPNGPYLFAIASPAGRGRRLTGGMSFTDDYIHGPFAIEFDSTFHQVVYDAEQHFIWIDHRAYDLDYGTVIFMQPNPAAPATPRVEQIAMPIDQLAFSNPQPQGGAMYILKQVQQYVPPHAIPVCTAPANIAVEVERLGSPAKAERDSAVEALVKIGKPAVPALIETLGFCRDDVRACAAEAIRKILAADPAAAPNSHTKQFWEKRLAGLKPDMRLDNALAFLLSDLSPADRQSQLSHYSGGATSTKIYYLDDYWRVIVFLHGDANDKLSGRAPMLSPEVRSVAPFLPEDYTGSWTQWYVNGQKMFENEYVNGIPHGMHTDYSFDGTKTEDYAIDHGTMDGVFTSYFADGRKASEAHFDHGKNTGQWRRWFQNGKPLSAFEFKNGKLNDTWTRWYPNGQKDEEKHYIDGQQNGPDSHWDEQGKLLWVHIYKDGKLVDRN